MSVSLGKRYVCEVCKTEVLCTKGSDDADLLCDDQPMVQAEVQKLPASD